MKILIDMNLSPRCAVLLQEDGFEAAHWSEVGKAYDPDPMVMAYAASYGFVLLTNDLDFEIALAAGDVGKPSVVQIRGEDLRPASIGSQVVQALRQMRAELEEAASLTIDPKRTRLRVLPLRERK